MPKERFYEEFVEENNKTNIKKAKYKVKNRLILLVLIIFAIVFFIAINSSKNKNETEKIHVESAKSVTDFETKELEDGTKITINRITIKGTEGIIYLNKEKEEKKESLNISISNVNEADNEIHVNEEGFNLIINLQNKTIEEVKE